MPPNFKAHKPDTIYATNQSEVDEFSFNQQVVDVFPDMINRSVPGYQDIVAGIGKIAAKTCNETIDACVYDLGCSLGNVSLSIAKQLQGKKINIIALDNSQAMVERCRQHISAYSFGGSINVIQGDLIHTRLNPSQFVVSNFTMQFVVPETRQAIVDKIFHSLLPSGIFVMSEKVKLENKALDKLMVDLHHDFKRDNGYSDLEISQKRSALENVMILDSIEEHKARLQKAGFTHVSVWYQYYNFLSIIARK